jgi:putative lipoprotein
MSDVEETNTVRGQIVLPNVEFQAGTADLIVQVEDVSRADAPSVVVGEQRISRVPLRAGAVLPFAVAIPAGLVDPNRSYSVRAHLDVSGSGKVDVGDLITTQSYPVLTKGYGNETKVTVKRV